MASKSVREKLAKNLLKKLSKEQNEQSAKTLKSSRPQVLFLEDLQFVEDTVRKVKEKKYVPESVKVKKIPNLLKEAQSIAKNVYQADYIANNLRYKTGPRDIENTHGGIYLKNEHPEVYKQIQEGTAFLMKSWSDLQQCKKGIITLAVDATEKQLDEIIKRVDRGHGAGAGFAVSQVTGARALGQADAALTETEKQALLTDLRTAAKDAFEFGEISLEAFDDIERLTIEYSQIVTPTGRIDVQYIPFVTFQNKYINQGIEAAREKSVLGFLRGYFNDRGADFLANLPGSSTLIQKAGASAIKPLLEVKNGKIKVSAEIDPRKIKFKTKGTASLNNSKQKSGSLKRNKAKVGGKVAPGAVTQATQTTYSVASLLGLFNAKISKQVLNNMEAPALENRTGRFASSVYVTDIIKTPKGFPSIGYTYDRNPYGVYESTSGSRFASPQRDPRILIDKSIREIAAQLAIGRLYTRRV